MAQNQLDTDQITSMILKAGVIISLSLIVIGVILLFVKG
jgi:uncharacterized membrane protein